MIVSILYFLLFFFIFLLVLVLQFFNRPPAPQPARQTPRVSILIAVRNEAHQIHRCLEALTKLDYPAEQLEIFIGDDASTDHTRAVIEEFIRDKPVFRLVAISGHLGRARGKGNVLAHLARLATTNFYFITDADIAVPPGWIRYMLGGLEAKTGIVTGITTIAGASLFHRMQALDWLNALGLIQVVSDLGVPVSTMGNNMLVTREAYESTGGYENLPFSVTEDVQLFQAVMRQGFTFRNIFSDQVLAWSTPAAGWSHLLHQRKRWMQGVRYLPWYMNLILIVYSSFYAFCLPFGFYTSAGVVLSIFSGKVFLQTLFISSCLKRLKLPVNFPLLILFEFYLIFVSLITIVFFLLPVKVRWKARKY